MIIILLENLGNFHVACCFHLEMLLGAAIVLLPWVFGPFHVAPPCLLQEEGPPKSDTKAKMMNCRKGRNNYQYFGSISLHSHSIISLKDGSRWYCQLCRLFLKLGGPAGKQVLRRSRRAWLHLIELCAGPGSVASFGAPQSNLMSLGNAFIQPSPAHL